MRPTAALTELAGGEVQAAPFTLLELVTRIDRVTRSEEETVEAVLALLDAGRVRLTGNFRGCRLSARGMRGGE